MNDAKDKIKVLLVAVSTDQIGGQAVQARRLLDAFAGEAEIEFDFVPTNPRFSSKFLARLQRIKILRTILNSIKFWSLLFLQIPKCGIVHAFSGANSSYLISTLPPLVVGKLFGKKLILHYHSGEAEEHLRRGRFLSIPTMRLADKIIVPSRFLVNVFAKFGLTAEAVPNFIELDKLEFRRRSPLRPVFLSNRNFEALYNVGCVLRAFARVQEKFPEAQLLIAGDGRERDKLKEISRELNLINVEFLGSVAPSEMPALYDRAEIYLNASNIDNMPLSLIEAMAAGLPVVSTNAGGIQYIIEHEETGLLVERNDYQALAGEAVKVLDNPALAQKIIANAREKVEKYSWAQVRGEWLNLYKYFFLAKQPKVLPSTSPVKIQNSKFKI